LTDYSDGGGDCSRAVVIVIIRSAQIAYNSRGHLQKFEKKTMPWLRNLVLVINKRMIEISYVWKINAPLPGCEKNVCKMVK
jgi:hypothetical protein